jgi:hypothetical protein
MKAASVCELKKELQEKSPQELVELCLRLSKFKKDNKELLTYLLYESENEEGYIAAVKTDIEEGFQEINRSNYYLIKKGLRKILRITKKQIRYSGKKETEVELLIFFCLEMRKMEPTFTRSTLLRNMYSQQLKLIERRVEGLHEDLQFDYAKDLEILKR